MLYNKLKKYKEAPSLEKTLIIEKQFDDLFLKDYQLTSLKLEMRRIHKNKQELLLVFKHPQISLHNNQSETDVRDKVVRRKLSVTYADESRRYRETFEGIK